MPNFKKKIINLINFFRLKTYKINKKISFFSDGKIKSLSQIKNISEKSLIVKKIQLFNSKIDITYKNLKDLPSPLQISSSWGAEYTEKRSEQIEIYKENNNEKILLLHENMFFNCLVSGLWNYAHYKKIKTNYTAQLNLVRDLRLHKVVFSNYDSLNILNPINQWGYKIDGNKFMFVSLDAEMQNKLITNFLKIREKKNNILEIGGGFGCLAEKLFKNEKVNSIVLTDLPGTLLTAYYYLASNYGTEKVFLVNNVEDLKNIDLDSNKKIILVPTCFYKEISNIKNLNLVCNFGSFSEMSFETIKFYLDNLPKDISMSINANSNITVKNLGSLEVTTDRFNFEENGFIKILEKLYSPFYCAYRYKTEFHIRKKNFII